MRNTKKRIEIIREVSSRLKLPIAILLDTKGPEFRIKAFEGGKITLNAGDIFTFRSGDFIGNKDGVCVNFEGLSTDVLFYFAQKTAIEIMDLQEGDNIVLTGGMINGTSGNTNLIKIATV